MRPHKHSITRGQMPGSLHSRRLHRESCALKQVGGSIYSHQREREVEVGSTNHTRGWGSAGRCFRRDLFGRLFLSAVKDEVDDAADSHASVHHCWAGSGKG